jgi:hypothetical protein
MTLLDRLGSTLAFGVLGLLLGFLQLGGLRLNVAAYVRNGVRLRNVLGHLLRLLAVALGFVVVARFGALPLFAAFAGLLGARTLAIRTVRRAP